MYFQSIRISCKVWYLTLKHRYRLEPPETALPDFKTLKKLIAAAGASTQVMVTEWGINEALNKLQGYSDSFPNYNKDIQAAVLARQWLVCMHSHVYPSIWYEFEDGPTSSDGW